MPASGFVPKKTRIDCRKRYRTVRAMRVPPHMARAHLIRATCHTLPTFVLTAGGCAQEHRGGARGRSGRNGGAVHGRARTYDCADEACPVGAAGFWPFFYG